MWPGGGSVGVSRPGPSARDFAKDNVINIKRIQARNRERAKAKQEEQAAASARRHAGPIKATRPLTVTNARSMINVGRLTVANVARTAGSSNGDNGFKTSAEYLHGHTKTGPFLEPGSNPENYYRHHHRSLDDVSIFGTAVSGVGGGGGGGHHDDVDHDEMDLPLSPVRFAEVTVEERKQRINRMVTDIMSSSVALAFAPASTGRPESVAHSVRSSGKVLRIDSAAHSEYRNGDLAGKKSLSVANLANRKLDSAMDVASKKYGAVPLTREGVPASINVQRENTNALPAMSKSKSMTIVANGDKNKPVPVQKPPSRAPSRSASLKDNGSQTEGSVVVPPTEEAKRADLDEGGDGGGSPRKSPAPSSKPDFHLDLNSLSVTEDTTNAPTELGSPLHHDDDLADGHPLRGADLDYVHANRDGASVLGHAQRRRLNAVTSARKVVSPLEDARAASAAMSAPSGYRAGVVPKYIVSRKEELRRDAEQRERRQRDAHDCPPDHVLLTEDERVLRLKGLNDQYEGLLREINAFPINRETLRMKERKREIEGELNKLDQDIRAFSRQRVFVKAGT